MSIAIQIRLNSSAAYPQAERKRSLITGELTIVSVMTPPHTPPIESREYYIYNILYILYWYVLKISTPVGWFSTHFGDGGLISGTPVGWFSAHFGDGGLIFGTPVGWFSTHFGNGGLISGTPVGWFSAHFGNGVLISGTPSVLIFSTLLDNCVEFQYTLITGFWSLQ